MLSFTSAVLGGTEQLQEDSVVAVVECEDSVWVIAPTGYASKAVPGSFESVVSQIPGDDMVPVTAIAGFGPHGQDEVMHGAGRAMVRRSAVTRATANVDGTGTWLYFASVPEAILTISGGF